MDCAVQSIPVQEVASTYTFESLHIRQECEMYVYKGHDRASVASNELTHDEVNTYIDARYVNAPEAHWRLSEHSLHQQSHAIVRLSIHLPDHQPVYLSYILGQTRRRIRQSIIQSLQPSYN